MPNEPDEFEHYPPDFADYMDEPDATVEPMSWEAIGLLVIACLLIGMGLGAWLVGRG